MDFTDVMAQHSDKQLVTIVTIEREEYQPEAIIAAEKEIERRRINIDSFNSSALDAGVFGDAESHRTDPPFEWYHKALTILAPSIIMSVISASLAYLGDVSNSGMLSFPIMVLILYAFHYKLKESGLTDLAKDFYKWLTYAFYGYIVIFLIVGLGIYFNYVKGI